MFPIHGGDASQGVNGNAELLQFGTPAFEFLLDEGTDANQGGTGSLGKAHQAVDSGTAGEEIINDEDAFTGRQVFGGDDEINHDTLGVRRSDGEINGIGHGDRFVFASIHHRNVEEPGGHESGGDAGDLGGEHAGGVGAGKKTGEFAPALLHEAGIHLVVDERVDLEDTITKVETFVFDKVDKLLHVFLPNVLKLIKS